MSEIAPTQMQHLALGLAEPHEALVGSLSQVCPGLSGKAPLPPLKHQEALRGIENKIEWVF